METWPEDHGLAREILICEQEGDRITHDIIQRLNRKLAAPMDREDIYQLASALDDVVDYIEEAADFLTLYSVEAPMEQAEQLSGVLRDACRNIAEALSRLHRFRDLNSYFAEIERLEHEGDRITREALASLFSDGVDPMVVIRWKDIFERLEEGIDTCKRASNVLQGIVVKHS
jgi:predicted phosphate transport protein (TIGR00153 family)